MKFDWTFWSKIAVAMVMMGAYGCSNDTIGTGQQDLCGDAACKDGEVCRNDRCVVLVGMGKDCSAENAVCRKGECIDGKCTETSSDAECEKDADCKDDSKACKDGACVDKADGKVPVGGACEKDGPACEKGSCIDGTCQETAGKDCSEDSKTSCGTGEYCDPEKKICVTLPGLEEACLAGWMCQDSLECDNDICVMKNVQAGEDCNGTSKLCEDGGECVEGKCHVKVTKGEACDEYRTCDGDELRCQGGTCKAIMGKCQHNDDCGGDSYCCLSDACEEKNICLPYEDGKVDETCSYKTVPGLFEASVQCEWLKPAPDDPYPNHYNVLTTPIVMKTPFDTGTAQAIIFTTYNCNDGGAPSSQGVDFNCNGVIRIIDGEKCELKQSIFDDNNHIIGASNLAMADLDGDGKAEIVTGRGSVQKAGGASGIVVFKWDDATKQYVTWAAAAGNSTGYGGPSIHDINGDGIPEIIGSSGDVFVFDAAKKTLTKLNAAQAAVGEMSVVPTLADADGDGNVEAIGTAHIFRWNKASNQWDVAYNKPNATGGHFGFADFGTRNADGTFDFSKLDGIAEIVACGSNIIAIDTLQGEHLMWKTGFSGGGPCTVGDFDGDGMPELATAFGDAYRIFDPRCKTTADGCATENILWQQSSQDLSSASTGSSLFDFDGDGQMEAVYADEAFTRIYDGKTGEVLFSSYHSSCTWYEYPVIADVDNDESAEIVVGSNLNCGIIGKSTEFEITIDGKVKKYAIDPVHAGVKCVNDSDCYSNKCVKGLCRCEDHSQCNPKKDKETNIVYEYACYDNIDAAQQADGKVCRAVHPQQDPVTGVRVLKDRLDRWMSSRNLWNQHVYTITNINDDMTIPKTVDWVMNFASGKNLNNLRQNVQGKSGANRAPDITGRFTGNVCQGGSGDKGVTLNAVICNRGTKMVAALMPATFYMVGDDKSLTKLCTSYTTANVPVGGCLPVSCDIDNEIKGTIKLKVNDDGNGNKTTVECNENNNEAQTEVNDCPVN